MQLKVECGKLKVKTSMEVICILGEQNPVHRSRSFRNTRMSKSEVQPVAGRRRSKLRIFVVIVVILLAVIAALPWIVATAPLRDWVINTAIGDPGHRIGRTLDREAAVNTLFILSIA